MLKTNRSQYSIYYGNLRALDPISIMSFPFKMHLCCDTSSKRKNWDQALSCWVTSDLCIWNLLGQVLSSLTTLSSMCTPRFWNSWLSPKSRSQVLCSTAECTGTPLLWERKHRAQESPPLLVWMLRRIHHHFYYHQKCLDCMGCFPVCWLIPTALGNL